MSLKNILLFRGDNTRELTKTVQDWRAKFIEKHGEMNLMEIRNDNIFESILADCLAPGFMGGTRMVIFYEHLFKTKKEQEKMEEKRVLEAEEKPPEDNNKNNVLENNALWIQTLARIPETNFILFIGNKTPVTDLEKWLEEHATIKEFPAVTPRDMMAYVMQHLPIASDQARSLCGKLGFYEEIRWGKTLVVGKPDLIYQEVAKLALAGKTAWTDAELDAVLPDYRDENAFDILDPLWDKQGQTMVQLWKRLMETADHELTMAMIITMIRKTLVAATFPHIGDIPITPGQRKNGQRLARDKHSLKKLYDSIIEVDIAEKSGELPHKTNAFLMALLGFCT